MKRPAWTWTLPDRCQINEGQLVSENANDHESIGKLLAPVRRLRASILEMMLLVAALAVSFRWPGLSVPVGLLFLYALARRRDMLGRQSRVAVGQVALAMYLPPALGLFCFPIDAWDQYLASFSLMPILALACIAVPRSLEDKAPMVALSLCTLAVIAGTAVIARQGNAWRISCLILASGMSALSTFFFWIVWCSQGC
jgi:hypothetical protein